MLGHGKAYEILLTSEGITARDALKLGIVDKIVPYYEFEDAVLNTAQNFAQKPYTSLSGIKKLLNYSLKDLEEHLRHENDLLIYVLSTSQQWKKFLAESAY